MQRRNFLKTIGKGAVATILPVPAILKDLGEFKPQIAGKVSKPFIVTASGATGPCVLDFDLQKKYKLISKSHQK